MYAFLIPLAWLYVALMMAVAEATSTNGTIIGAVFTFVAYGVLPVSLIGWFITRGARRRARELREEREASNAPDGGGEAPAGAVAPVRKEP